MQSGLLVLVGVALLGACASAEAPSSNILQIRGTVRVVVGGGRGWKVPLLTSGGSVVQPRHLATSLCGGGARVSAA